MNLLITGATGFVGGRIIELFRFGVSPNKLFDYLYAEKPILYAIESGKYLPAEDPKAIAGAILKLKTLSPEEHNKMGQNGHEYALKNHDYAKLSVKLANVLMGEK